MDLAPQAKRSFLFFCKYVLRMELPPHFEEWEYCLFNYDRVLLECARGHGKSLFVSRALPLWLAYRGIPVEILLISYSETQVEDLMRKMEEEINSNDLLAELRPGQDTVWQTTLFTFKNGTSITGRGFGSSVRGLHPDWIIVDDPLKDDGGIPPPVQIKYFTTALTGTAKKNTRIVVIGTPLDPGDLLEYLENNKAYLFKAYPGDDGQGDEIGNPLFPYLYDKESLRKKRIEMGTLAYAREIRLQRIDPATQVFKDQFKTVNTEYKWPDFESVRTFLDPAISEREEACDTAITTWGKDFSNHRWELETRVIHSDNVAEMLRELMKACRIYQHVPNYAVVIEAELFQRLLAEKFREMCLNEGLNIKVIAVTHTGNTGKHQRIQGLQPMWETRAIHLLPDSAAADQFRNYRPKAKNIRVDIIDAFSWTKDERVDYPVVPSTTIVGEVPDDARPD